MRYIGLFLLLTLATVFSGNVENGKKIYDQWCAQCHGYEGDGMGYAEKFTFPKPRDFTVGVYKFKSTVSGMPPLDEDLVRSIREGMHGTTMPGWKRFSDEEVRDLIAYIKTFSEDVFEDMEDVEKVEISSVPKCDDAKIKLGKELYHGEAKCIDCHGKAGRGDGEKIWEPKFKDDWGNKIYPANHTHPWEFRRGTDLKDIYTVITGGIDGTPMTSYVDSLNDEQRWALACYVRTLFLTRKLGPSVRFVKVDSLPQSPTDPLWDTVDYLDLPMAGQITLNERNFTPVLTNVRVRGVYTETEVAVLLEWSDRKLNRGEDGLPPDTLYLKFPQKLAEGPEKPHFIIGDKKKAMYIWRWSVAEEGAKELIAKGPDRIKEQEGSDVRVSYHYKDGLYRVLFVRKLSTGDKEDLEFTVGKFIPFSVSVFDGQEGEREPVKGAVSAWYYLILEPPTPMKVYILPPAVFLVSLGIGMFLHRKLRGQV